MVFNTVKQERKSGVTNVFKKRIIVTLDLKTGKCNIRLPLLSEARSLTISNQSSVWALMMDFTKNEIYQLSDTTEMF